MGANNHKPYEFGSLQSVQIQVGSDANARACLSKLAHKHNPAERIRNLRKGDVPVCTPNTLKIRLTSLSPWNCKDVQQHNGSKLLMRIIGCQKQWHNVSSWFLYCILWYHCIGMFYIPACVFGFENSTRKVSFFIRNLFQTCFNILQIIWVLSVLTQYMRYSRYNNNGSMTHWISQKSKIIKNCSTTLTFLNWIFRRTPSPFSADRIWILTDWSTSGTQKSIWKQKNFHCNCSFWTPNRRAALPYNYLNLRS